MDAVLNVFLHNLPVGKLWLDEKRRFVFQYDQRWLESPEQMPLSLSLPLRSKPYEDDSSRPFFSNLLPEAGLRQAVARKLGVSEQNDFALLWELGGECAGAVTLLPEGQEPESGNEYVPLTEEQLHEIIKSLPTRPLLAGEEGIRLSLAGAQNKLPVFIKDGIIHLPKSGSPSSHIIKPPIRDLDGIVENEAFCMMLARKMGLPVPDVRILTGEDTLYLIQRYDRLDADGGLIRVHQEDFCQALGVSPDLKYESEGGPSLKICFTLLKERSTAPAVDIKILLSWVVFNLLIGNADAHAKNLALLFTKEGLRLAPFYDLLCTAIYEELTDKLAMKIGGENRPDLLRPSIMDRFAKEIGVRPKMVISAFQTMAEEIVPASEVLAEKIQAEYGERPVVQKVVDVIKKRSRSVLLTLNASAGTTGLDEA